MNEPTHLDLFSGIGGFAIAARRAGFRTVAFCEADQRCRSFLEKTWGVPVEPDVRKLDGRRYAGISVLTGGPPCQPASRAGKQGGASDDRWLWPEALRVLDEAKPDCVVFENPLGIGDVGLDGILAAMEGSGHEVQCFDIPACAVDSPQLRHRYWIVGFRVGDAAGGRFGANGSASGNTGHTDESGKMLAHTGSANGEGRQQSAVAGSQSANGQDAGCSCLLDGELADSAMRRRPGSGQPGDAGNQEVEANQSFHDGWSNSVWVPCADGKLRRAPDDSFGLVDGLHRSILGALGNSICPEVAYRILTAVKPLIQT